MHGDSDKTVPLESSGAGTSEMIHGARYIVYEDRPHGIFYTHKEKVNNDLLSFIKQ
jgi:non-heme chloroperoxidase